MLRKIATLEKEGRDQEEKMNKIKAVTVEAKEELDKSRKDVVALTEEVGALKARMLSRARQCFSRNEG